MAIDSDRLARRGVLLLLLAVLGTSEMTHIQVGGDKNAGFTLEYQEGAVDAHYQTTSQNIPLDPVVRAFIAYRDGKAGWQKEFTFKRITW